MSVSQGLLGAADLSGSGNIAAARPVTAGCPGQQHDMQARCCIRRGSITSGYRFRFPVWFSLKSVFVRCGDSAILEPLVFPVRKEAAEFETATTVAEAPVILVHIANTKQSRAERTLDLRYLR